MTTLRHLLATVLVAFGAILAPLAANPRQAPERAPGTLREGVTAVLVDVVVRDKRNQPVRDLVQSDFEVLEDGVAQSVGAFTAIEAGASSTLTPARPLLPAAPPAGGTVVGSRSGSAIGTPIVALVFHSLPLESRRRALQAAQNYIGNTEETANYVGVFDIDLTLRSLVPFTRNGVAVRTALDQMATGASSSGSLLSAGAASDRTGSAAALTPGLGPGGPTQIGSLTDYMLESFASLELDREGYILTDAMSAMVRTLGRLPGRKSIVLFSEGIKVPPAVHRLYLGVIDAANRANVSIYTVDAAGLRAQSAQSGARDGIVGLAQSGLENSYSAESSGRPLTMRLEGNEYLLRSNPHWNLGTLAEETGGLLFDNANDLKPAFQRIDSDLRNYYLLGYTPLNRSLDGKFRAIQVKVKRPGVTVAARKGYFAVRNPANLPINAWEAPALGALEQKPVPNAFPLLAATLHFPERGRPGLVPVVAELPTASVTFEAAADGKTYTSDFTVLVRFLDRDNQVVRKVSQHYEIRGELPQMANARRGQVLFYRESELPPGVYSAETVVHDALANRSSARFSTVEIPRYEEGRLRMSSLVLVRRGDEVRADDRPSGNPLVVNGVALQPNLGRTVSSTDKELAFYFTVYPSAGAPPEVFIQLARNGAVVSQVPMSVEKEHASGRIQQLGRLPIGNLSPGTYELRAIVKQGSEQAVQTTTVTVTK
jgi:VWFA-related protein